MQSFTKNTSRIKIAPIIPRPRQSRDPRDKKERLLPLAETDAIFGDPSEIRTPDTLIKSQVLCQLS